MTTETNTPGQIAAWIVSGHSEYAAQQIAFAVNPAATFRKVLAALTEDDARRFAVAVVATMSGFRGADLAGATGFIDAPR